MFCDFQVSGDHAIGKRGNERVGGVWVLREERGAQVSRVDFVGSNQDYWCA